MASAESAVAGVIVSERGAVRGPRSGISRGVQDATRSFTDLAFQSSHLIRSLPLPVLTLRDGHEISHQTGIGMADGDIKFSLDITSGGRELREIK